jgi:hypothetical protein
MPLPRKPRTTIPLIARITGSSSFKAVLWPLEKMTGGKPVGSDGASLVVADRLTPQLLDDFFANRILAIHVPNFVEPDACNHLANNIIGENLSNWNVYDLKNEYKASDVNVLGSPFNMACRSEESWRDYFESAERIADRIRQLASPFPCPLDNFRAVMAETWEHGIVVESYKGHQMTPGLARVMYDKDIINPDAPLGCHVDSPPMLSDKAGQFSVNIYLRQPDTGGHLYIWNAKITTLLQALKNWNLVKNFFLESNYLSEAIQLKFQKLLPPPVKLHIGQGDLVLLHTGRPHAVVPFRGGPRVSLQAFLNHRKGKPIAIWA